MQINQYEPDSTARRRFTPLLWLLPLVMAMTGCAGYQLQGKTIEGATSGVFVVDADDPRLGQPGLAGTVIDLTLDPDRLSAKPVGADVSGMDGQFAIPIDEFGAGLLEYRVRVVARLRGHRSVSSQIMVPGSGKRVLIVLAEGDEGAPPPSEDVIEETLRMGAPYMNGN